MQRWATGRDSSPKLVSIVGGGEEYAVGITYCVLSAFDYSTGECLDYGGLAGYSRCLRCPDLVEHRYEWQGPTYPKPQKDMCLTGDRRLNVRRSACRSCSQRIICMHHSLKHADGLRLVRIRKKPKH